MLSGEITKKLTLVAPVCQVRDILVKSWIIVILPQNLSREGSTRRVIFVAIRMNFFKNNTSL